MAVLKHRKSMVSLRTAALLLVAAGLLVTVRVVTTLQESPAKQHLFAGISYAERGMGEQAEAEWKAAIHLDPNCSDAYRLLGEFYLSTRRYVSAVKTFQALLKVRPKEPHIYCSMAEAELKGGAEGLAAKHAEEELKRDPDCLKALSIAGALWQKTSDRRQAEHYLSEVVRRRPHDWQALLVLSRYLTHIERFEDAQPVLRRLKELNPRLAETDYLLGVCFARDPDQGRALPQAKRHFLRALRKDPLHAQTRYELGRLYLLEGKPQKALLHLELAAELAPKEPSVFYSLSQAYQRIGRKKLAEAARKRFRTLRHREVLESSLTKRCAADPNDASSHYRLGRLKMEKGEYDAAIYFLEVAAHLKPHDEQIKNMLKRLKQLMQPPPRGVK